MKANLPFVELSTKFHKRECSTKSEHTMIQNNAHCNER